MSYEYTGPGPEQEYTPPKSKKTRNCCLLSCGGCGCLVIVMVLLGVIGISVGGNLFYAKIDDMTIAEAMFEYSLDHGEYPPAYSVDENGKPLHSWRVLILPYFDEEVYPLFYRGPLPSEVYDKIRLDEPWDSDYNRQFHSQMPLCYRNSGLKEEGKTYFQMVTGSKCLSDGPHNRLAEEVDEADRPVVLFVQAAPAVEWMKPQDLAYDDMMKNGVVSENSGVPGLTCPHRILTARMGTVALSDGDSPNYTDEKSEQKRSRSSEDISLELLYEYATMDTEVTAHDEEAAMPDDNVDDQPDENADDPFADETSP